MTDRMVAVLGLGLVDPASPVLRADDLGALRGDGIFETVLVRDGSPWLLDAHLDRFARSAARMELALPDRADWQELAGQLTRAWPPAVEGMLRFVCTRGPEDGGLPTAFAVIAPVPAELVRQRIDGVRVVTLSLGVAAAARQEAPWLLGAVKSTSYAVAMAAIRHAKRVGADDAIYLSSDGQVLEAPTASVVWSVGDVLCTVPLDVGILPGTTVAELFRRAAAHGVATELRHATVEDLHAADGVWLLSAVRGVTAVRTLDGHDRPPSGLTDRLWAVLDGS